MTKLEIRIIDLVVDAIGKGAREWDAYAIPSPVPAVEAARLIMLAIAEDPDMPNDSRYIAELNTRINLQEDRIEQLEAALYRIRQWAHAYPLGTFPEPDMEQAAIALKTFGITLDAVSASNMRHVLEGVVDIANTALDDGSKEYE